jgi:hypothetical protein
MVEQDENNASMLKSAAKTVGRALGKVAAVVGVRSEAPPAENAATKKAAGKKKAAAKKKPAARKKAVKKAGGKKRA